MASFPVDAQWGELWNDLLREIGGDRPGMSTEKMRSLRCKSIPMDFPLDFPDKKPDWACVRDDVYPKVLEYPMFVDECRRRNNRKHNNLFHYMKGYDI